MLEVALRIALLTHSVKPRGGVMHTVELAQALQAAGHEVTVMAPAAPGERLFRELSCAVELVDVPAPHATTREMIRTRIAAYVRHLAGPRGSRPLAEEFDVFHAHDGIGGNALASLCERSLIPGFVRTVHHLDDFGDPEIDAWQERAVRCAHRVICVSRLWRDTLEATYGIAATVIGNGVNRQRFSPLAAPGDAEVARRLGLKPGAPLIVCVGGIERRKNTLRILEAWQRLRRELPRAQLAVVGGASLLDHSDYRGSFDAAVTAAGVRVGPGEELVLTGAVADADMPAILRLADAVAFPSVTEGFGLVALEALASGTPTVVSRSPPFTEYLSGDEVHWADPLDVASIAAALRAAVSAPKFAPPAVCERCSWSASAAQHVALYCH
jgi:glycosyltransferase-like protein